ncbi:hypothetical protein ACEPPN_012322 [Leptodophora sp. 'Broadleaf-Isolate-01']
MSSKEVNLTSSSTDIPSPISRPVAASAGTPDREVALLRFIKRHDLRSQTALKDFIIVPLDTRGGGGEGRGEEVVSPATL